VLVQVTRTREPGPQDLRQGCIELYGMTPAETKVAALIALSIPGRRAAQELGISYNTLKTHMRRIFDKTDTHGRGELIRLLSRQ
jgi:DNA-binding CsgD family transcriptional regulator